MDYCYACNICTLKPTSKDAKHQGIYISYKSQHIHPKKFREGGLLKSEGIIHFENIEEGIGNVKNVNGKIWTMTDMYRSKKCPTHYRRVQFNGAYGRKMWDNCIGGTFFPIFGSSGGIMLFNGVNFWQFVYVLYGK